MNKKQSLKVSLTGASCTHRGLVKENNEDAIMLHISETLNGDRRGLLMVADGVGGHLAGEVASGLAVQTVQGALVEILEDKEPESPSGMPDATIESKETHIARLLRKTVEKANQNIIQYAQEHQDDAGNLGTTTTCGVVYDELLVIAHVGDSRAYRLRSDSFEQLTQDHTFVGEMVRLGQFSADAFYEHPRRHVITRALGQKPDLQVDIVYVDVQPDDRLLFCSDGLWEMVRDGELKSLLSDASSPQDAVDALFNSAMDAGGVDNIGIIVGDIHGR